MIAVSVSFLVENNAPCWRIQILRRDNQYGFSSRLSRYIRGLRDAMCASGSSIGCRTCQPRLGFFLLPPKSLSAIG